jgi:hypothetical protein
MLLSGRYRELNGRNADSVQSPSLTQSGHRAGKGKHANTGKACPIKNGIAARAA